MMEDYEEKCPNCGWSGETTEGVKSRPKEGQIRNLCPECGEILWINIRPHEDDRRIEIFDGNGINSLYIEDRVNQEGFGMEIGDKKVGFKFINKLTVNDLEEIEKRIKGFRKGRMEED